MKPTGWHRKYGKRNALAPQKTELTHIVLPPANAEDCGDMWPRGGSASMMPIRGNAVNGSGAGQGRMTHGGAIRSGHHWD